MFEKVYYYYFEIPFHPSFFFAASPLFLYHFSRFHPSYLINPFSAYNLNNSFIVLEYFSQNFKYLNRDVSLRCRVGTYTKGF
jgi:hypothetical protein